MLSVSVVSYLDYLVFTFLTTLFNHLASYMIAPGVSLLGFLVAVAILCVVIGAVVLRVR